MSTPQEVITADDIALSIAASISALVKADGRTRVAIAALAWPELGAESGRKRLRRLMTGELELRPRDAAGLSLALGCSWRDLYTGVSTPARAM